MSEHFDRAIADWREAREAYELHSSSGGRRTRA